MISKTNFLKKKIVYCFSSAGEKIGIKNDNVIVKDKEGKVKLQTSCYSLFAIYIIGETSITSALIRYSYKFGFSIVMMSNSFKTYEILGFKMEGNTLLCKKQYEYKDTTLAKFFVENKINNQINTLKKIRVKTENNKFAIKEMRRHLVELKNTESDINYIMGKEGICAKLYFKEIYGEYDWDKRIPRIKKDYINSTMDIGYTMLFNYIDSILRIYGFDTYVGFLHQQFYMRKSLVCDFVEPFRSIIDWQIRKSINLNQINEDDFKQMNKKYVLKWEKNKIYVQIFSQAINEYNDEIFEFIQSFYRSFMKNKDIDEYRTFDI